MLFRVLGGNVKDVFLLDSIDWTNYFQVLYLLYPCDHLYALGQLYNKASTTNSGVNTVADACSVSGPETGGQIQMEIYSQELVKYFFASSLVLEILEFVKEQSEFSFGICSLAK